MCSTAPVRLSASEMEPLTITLLLKIIPHPSLASQSLQDDAGSSYTWQSMFPTYILSRGSDFTLASGQRDHNLFCLCLKSQNPYQTMVGKHNGIGAPASKDSKQGAAGWSSG